MNACEFQDPPVSALFTDLYELTMAQAYWAQGRGGRAVFELFFRDLPDGCGMVIAAGLEPLIEALKTYRFTDPDLDYLREQKTFSEPFLQYLRDWRFRGDVHAVAEGVPIFPEEPAVQIVAPILDAQLVETLVMNQFHVATVLATKADRVVRAAGGAPVVDFGSRRAHGADAALHAARSTWLVGGAGTSNVLAGRRFGLPLRGTMAHSYIQSFARETEAFETFAHQYPNTTLLVDTYDTLAGVARVIEMLGNHPELDVGAVRLDSGDLAELARESRRRLDAAGFEDVKIFVSGGLDEYAVAELVGVDAPIDGFGVGTRLSTADGMVRLDVAYKLVEYDGRPVTKLAEGKTLWPGRKQVFRRFSNGGAIEDLIALVEEPAPEAGAGEAWVPLLTPVLKTGRPVEERPEPLAVARERYRDRTEVLPASVRRLAPEPETYPVGWTARLRELQRLLQADHSAGVGS